MMNMEHRAANRDRAVIFATTIVAAIVGVLGVVFAQSDQVERVSAHAEAVVAAEHALAALTELRSNVGISLVLSAADAEGVGVEETPALAIAQSRRSMQDLVSATDNLDESVVVLREPVGELLEAVLVAIETGDLDESNRLARSDLLPTMSELASALRTDAQEHTEIIAIEGSSAGDVARAASLAVALLVPASAVLVVRRSLRKRAEREVLELELKNQREQNDARDELIASLAHQIRTPLSGVYGFAEAMFDLIEAGDPDIEFLEEATATIFDQSFEIRRLIDDLMVATRSDAGLLEKSMVEIDVQRATSAAVEPFTKSGHVDLILDVSPGQAMADSLRLQHILRNLIHNAVTHGGAELIIKGRTGNGRYVIAVGDNGPGLDTVGEGFTPFLERGAGARTSGALGLGLSVARSLTELMDGALEYRREDGRTWFVLTLATSLSSAQDLTSRAGAKQLSAL